MAPKSGNPADIWWMSSGALGNPAAVGILPESRMRLDCMQAMASGCVALLSAASSPMSSTDLRAYYSSRFRRP
eukprot:14030038-Heterocapsa_arctica.AAC.1